MEPTTTAALIGAGGSLLGGILGGSGQSAANRSNERIARENRAFQERMSNTAHQRAAYDLEKAGLNRILSIAQPANTPAGATATMQNAKAIPAQAVATLGKQLAEIKLITANTRRTNAMTDAIAVPAEVGKKFGPSVSGAIDDFEGLLNEAAQSLGTSAKSSRDFIKSTIQKYSQLGGSSAHKEQEKKHQKAKDIKKDNDGKTYIMVQGKRRYLTPEQIRKYLKGQLIL